MKKRELFGHLIALFTIIVWSTTFISSKVLLRDFSPIEIIIYRFIIGYLSLLIMSPSIPKNKTWRDEIIFFALGLTGVSLYFLAENYALTLTTVSNVGLLITLAPILTILLAHFSTKEKLINKATFIGFTLAIMGVFLVMYNGHFIASIHPLGDFLAITAAAIWAIYSNILRRIIDKFPTTFVVRKSFFYGIISMVLLLPFIKEDMLPTGGLSVSLVGNIVFLSIIASALCYILWNEAMKLIGMVKTSNYIYLMPLITMIASWIILDETINVIMIIGGILIIVGVYISQSKTKEASVCMNTD